MVILKCLVTAVFFELSISLLDSEHKLCTFGEKFKTTEGTADGLHECGLSQRGKDRGIVTWAFML